MMKMTKILANENLELYSMYRLYTEVKVAIFIKVVGLRFNKCNISHTEVYNRLQCIFISNVNMYYMKT